MPNRQECVGTRLETTLSYAGRVSFATFSST